MTGILGGACGLAVAAGLWLVVMGSLRRVDAGRRPRTRASDRRRVRLSRVQQVRLAAGLVAGFVAFLVTAAAVWLVLLPVLVVLLPEVLADPPNRDIDVLAALDRWVRGLSSSLPTGKSIQDAIRATAHQAPPLLAEPVATLVARMDDRWTLAEALGGFADDLDAPEADAVVAALVLCARRGGTGAAVSLSELAATIGHRLRALREVEAERSKPRVVVRQVTTITLVVLGLGMVFASSYFAPYWTPIGQAVFAVLTVCFVSPLVVMRRMTVPRRRERILQRRNPGEVAHA